MELVSQHFEILTPQSELDSFLQRIERAGRTCYKSEEKITIESAAKFVESIIARGHDSVLEHCSISVRFVTDRGVTHELVRHRLAAFSQESTRYCNYANKGIKFIYPVDFILDEEDMLFLARAERQYLRSLHEGRTPQQARYFLPNGLKTEIVVTANIREWRHIFGLRTSAAAHPQMRELMTELLSTLQLRVPVLFNDFILGENGNG